MTQVLITIGQQLPFDRLIQTADVCAAELTDWAWLAQIGEGGFQPSHMKAVETLDQALFDATLADTDILICHAGIGTIMRALTLGKPVIVMARDADRGEHRNHHQRATLARLSHVPGIYPIENEIDMRTALDQIQSRDQVASAFDVGPADPRLLAVVDAFVAKASMRG